MRHFPYTTFAVAVVTLLAWGTPIQAQAIDDAANETANQALNDLFVLLINGPVYLSSRLPMMMAAQPPEPGMQHDKPGDFSFGVGLKSDVYSQFKDVAYGAGSVTDLDTRSPDTVPLPSLSLYGRLAVLDDLDVGARFDFIPSFEQKVDELDLAAGYFIVGAGARYRVLSGDGGSVPDLVLGAGLAYFQGELEIGRELSDTFDKELQSEEFGAYQTTGSFQVSGSPVLSWSLYQFQMDARAQWLLGGWFRPYIGLGTDITVGDISSSLTGNLNVTVDTINGLNFDGEPVSQTDADFQSGIASESPTLLALHPVLGLDFLLSDSLRLTLQGDVHMPLHQQATKQDDQIDELFTINGARDDNFYYIRYRDTDDPFRNPAFSLGVGLRYDFAR